MSSSIKPMNIRSLFKEDFYNIPIYQRNYAWTSVEVNQLIQDVIDAATKKPGSKYYLGNLIVDKRKSSFETIDGQQRMTTLFIILCALKKLDVQSVLEVLKEINISFEHRKNSEKSLKRLFDGETGKIRKEDIETDKYELHIIDIFSSVLKDLPKLCSKVITIDSFAEYLLDNVIILRIEVPDRIDKNHYFEVMNSRGVQLEQHEIIKARMMRLLDHNHDRKTFDLIWEACSEMGRFCQMNFTSVDCRKAIFGEDWTDFPETNFNKISDAFRKIRKDNDGKPISIRKMIDDFNDGDTDRYCINKEDQSRKDDQFYPIINFPGLLLQALKVCRPDKDVPLYDKALVKTFNEVIDSEPEKSKFAKEFSTCLLMCRYMLDTFVLRRNKEDEWGIYEMRTTPYKNSLHAYTAHTFYNDDGYDSNDELLMLQSMFHFSIPSMNYKNWLNGILAYLFRTYKEKKEIDPDQFEEYLQNLAKAYMLDWYLTDDTIDFMTMIHENHGLPTHTIDSFSDDDIKEHINQGTDVDAFVFNYYDYLIWKESEGQKPFHFTYRTSVEHFYPQHPTGNEPLEQDGPYLHSFGNLCLISTSMNSKFTNRMPVAKYAEYGGDDKARSLSLKLQEMFNVVETNKAKKRIKHEWFKDDIAKAEKEAIARFRTHLG